MANTTGKIQSFNAYFIWNNATVKGTSMSMEKQNNTFPYVPF